MKKKFVNYWNHLNTFKEEYLVQTKAGNTLLVFNETVIQAPDNIDHWILSNSSLEFLEFIKTKPRKYLNLRGNFYSWWISKGRFEKNVRP